MFKYNCYSIILTILLFEEYLCKYILYIQTHHPTHQSLDPNPIEQTKSFPLPPFLSTTSLLSFLSPNLFHSSLFAALLSSLFLLLELRSFFSNIVLTSLPEKLIYSSAFFGLALHTPSSCRLTLLFP